MDVPPATLFCLPESPEATMTVSGGHFGPAGASVTFAEDGGTGRWECISVQHVPGSEDSMLLCTGVHRGFGVGAGAVRPAGIARANRQPPTTTNPQ